MENFTYAVKTVKSNDSFIVLCSGTKKRMLEVAEIFDAHAETIESRIRRENDGKIVHHYVR